MTDQLRGLGDLKLTFPRATKGRLVVWGLLGSAPYGGMTWQVLHHLVALRSLGFDVWYVEDSDNWVRSPNGLAETAYYEPNLAFLGKFMKLLGMEDRWIFRVPETSDLTYGHSVARLHSLYREADAVFNLCGSHYVLPHHGSIGCLVYVETDPVANQVGVADGYERTIDQLSHHHYLFTYGENIGTPRFSIPIERFHWHTTRPPVWVGWWATQEPPSSPALTTIANLRHENDDKDVVWRGQLMRWSKYYELEKFIRLPAKSALPLELALGAVTDGDRSRLRGHGWQVRYSIDLSDPMKYRKYVASSKGEFTVAKEQYVISQCGWFSDRSVCYLAAGRPVITQATGFQDVVPTGEGLFSFSTEEEALSAIGEVAGDYQRHSEAASKIAHEYFDAGKVLGDVLRTIGLL